jgi:serine/threonine protein kinase
MYAGADYSSDWWAVGVLLCELITGRTPFSSENTTELDLYENITTFQYGQIKIPGISPEMEDFLFRLLHPDPSKRLGKFFPLFLFSSAILLLWESTLTYPYSML